MCIFEQKRYKESILFTFEKELEVTLKLKKEKNILKNYLEKIIEFNSNLAKIKKNLNEANEKSSIIKIRLALEENKPFREINQKQNEEFLNVSFLSFIYINFLTRRSAMKITKLKKK